MTPFYSVIQVQIPPSETYAEDFAEVLETLSEEIEEEYLNAAPNVRVDFVDSTTALLNLEHEEDWKLYEVIGFLASSLYREGFNNFSFLVNDLEYNA